ncbi:MAG TPA: sulfotransferase domain-containing protein [Terriglobales bacterium]|nr:sulfotransferase domain-containing protein [Terriglobales bacterium]
MLRRFRYQLAKSRLRIPLVWYRHRGLTPYDVFVASYPRSGSTWLRFLLFETLTRNEAGFDNVNRMLPDVGMHAGATALLANQGRLIKTHEAFRPEYRRAIYVVRDARDVVLSEYAYQKALGRGNGSFDGYLTEFLHGTATGYGSWLDHVGGWIDSPLAARGDLLVIRYRDLRNDTQSAMEEILQFLGVGVDCQTILNAIRNNEFQKMRVKEDRNPQLGKSGDESRRFVRKGAVGGWHDQLTAGQLARIEEKAGKMLVRLGFDSERSGFSRGANVAASAD